MVAAPTALVQAGTSSTLTNGQATAETDVLIVGAGPAGVMLAAWLAKLGVPYRIVDKRSSKLFTGQADGLQCRTMEVFKSFGIAHRVELEGQEFYETVFWNPDESGRICRSQRMPDTAAGTSHCGHYALHQGRIERFLLDLAAHEGGAAPERCVLPDDLTVDHAALADPTAYPLTVRLRHLSEDEAMPVQNGKIPNGLFRSNALDESHDATARTAEANARREVLRAKYVVGCDGARSWVREQMGLKLEGDSANVYWGVIDSVPVTNFPDIRTKVAIHSASAGSILIIPREDDICRIYVQMGEIEAGRRLDRGSISLEQILEKARVILEPYTLECPEITWWTIYEIGQRVAPKMSMHDRIFIAGDAAHLHSPKAGQGMNVSMMDTYNLGWKLASVIKGQADPSILATYEAERHQVARELIEFDYKFSRLFSGKPAKDLTDAVGISLAEFEAVWRKFGAWTAGTAVDYQSSALVAKTTSRSDLATGLTVGMRFPSTQVVTLSSGRPRQLLDLLTSDGRWRLVVFTGDVRESETKASLDRLVAYLDSPKSIISRYTPAGADRDAAIEVLTVVGSPRSELDYESFADALRPLRGPHRYRNHHKVFVDDEAHHHGHGKAYERYGVSSSALVVVRPDGYVAGIYGVEETSALDAFFGHFML